MSNVTQLREKKRKKDVAPKMEEVVKVLLVDDDEDEFVLNRDLLNEFQNRKFTLDWVETYEKGLAAMLKGAHDCYLIDHYLGEHTGIDLLKAVQEAGIHRAAIFLTGQGDDQIDQSALELGVSDYLVKGEVSASTLERAIRYAVEKERIQTRLRFQAQILRNIHDGVFYVNGAGIVQDWNEGATRIFGIAKADAVGKTVEQICPARQADHPFTTRILPAIEAEGKAEEVIRCHTSDGKEIHILAKVTRMSQGREDGYVFCVSDITREKRLEAEIVRISEDEQRRIGQDIHDDLCSQLSGIGCLSKVLEQQLHRHEIEEANMMEKITEMVSNAGVKAREIARGLVPTVLETQGLTGAIRELVERQREMYSVDCSARIEGEEFLEELDQETLVQLYRITQEGVANAIKHSDAETITIMLNSNEERLVLSIRDDGKGMIPGSVSSGMGLLTMQRRAEIIGAGFAIKASPGEGTEIRCQISSEVV